MPDMLVTVWGVSKGASGGLASITALLPAVTAPVIGLAVDTCGFRVPICVFAGVGDLGGVWCKLYLVNMFASKYSSCRC
jgi:hypothetical protein